MAFKVIRKTRGKGKENFVPLGEPEELEDGKSVYEVGESLLSLTVLDGSRLLVHLDESEGGIAVTPFGDDVERIVKIHGVTGVEFDAKTMRDGKTVARLLDEDEEGTLYQYRVVVHRPSS